MNINIDSPSKLRKGEGVNFPATIKFKSQLSAICLEKDEQEFKRKLAPTSMPYTESDILAPVPRENISFHIFDPAIYAPSRDKKLNDSARKKLQHDITEACSRTGGFKAIWPSLQTWGPRDLTHYRVSTLKCNNSRAPPKTKCNDNAPKSKEASVYKFASTNNSRSLHSVSHGNSERKRKTCK